MTEPDPLLSRLRDLPSPAPDPHTRARVIDRAVGELADGGRRAAVLRMGSSWALPAALLACEAFYVLDVIVKVRALFG